MSRMTGNLPDDARNDVEDLQDHPSCDKELTEVELDDVSGGEDGWVPPPPPPPTGGAG